MNTYLYTTREKNLGTLLNGALQRWIQQVQWTKLAAPNRQRTICEDSALQKTNNPIQIASTVCNTGPCLSFAVVLCLLFFSQMPCGKYIPTWSVLAASFIPIFSVSAAAQFVTVTADHVLNSAGQPVASGTVCLQATDSQDDEILMIWMFGHNSTVTSQTGGPFCAAVSGGHIAQLQVPDPAGTYPRNYLYRVTVYDELSGDSQNFPTINVSGPSFSWDAYFNSFRFSRAIPFRAEMPIRWKTTSLTKIVDENLSADGPVTAGTPVLRPPAPTSTGGTAIIPQQPVTSNANETATAPVTPQQAAAVPAKVNALDYSGGDVGAKINTAAASLLHGGQIYLPPMNGCYSYTTPILLPNMVSLTGAGPYSTCLQFEGTGIALTLQSQAELSNLNLSGETTHRGTGLLVLGAYSTVEHVYIDGFDLGVTFGNNSYLDSFYHVHIEHNTRNLYYPPKLRNSGENFSFVSSVIAGGGNFANCVQIGEPGVLTNGEFSFISTSFDTCQVVNNESMVKFFGAHFEDGNAASDHPFLKTVSNALQGEIGDVGSYLYGSSIQTNLTPTGPALFEVDHFGQRHLFGVLMNAVPTIPLVKLGTAPNESPTLELVDNANTWPESKLYWISPGAVPFLNISTQAVSQHTSFNTHIFASSTPGKLYGTNDAIALSGSFLGEYVWSGTGSNWVGSKLMIDPNNGFQVCNTGFFSFSGYSALGSESSTCNTVLGDSSITTHSFREALTTPASSTAPCNPGQFTDDSEYHYVCVAENTWKRAALSSF